MTSTSPRSLQSLVPSFLRNRRSNFILTLLMMLVSSVAYATQAPTPTPPPATITTLSISSNTIQYQSPVILQAKVTTLDGSPVTTGLVLFCDATAKFCENNSALATIQLSSPGAVAYAKLGSGPLGNHSYMAVYRANNAYGSSTSNTVSYKVVGTYGSIMSLSSTGNPGNYTLQSSVTGIGSLVAGPTGSVSFLDTSVGDYLLGKEPLGTATLSTTFATAPNSPFPIGDAGTTKSVTVASAYLHYFANNLDIVTGDSDSVITVLQGNGDGTFKAGVNYTGCTTGGSVKMLLADFNRDGITDLALACTDGKTNGGLAILIGDANGDGGFNTPVFYSTGDAAGIALGDFNNDGIWDIALTNRGQQSVVLFLGNGDGTFQEDTTILATSSGTSTLSTPMKVHDVVVGDFNGTGNDDIAYAVSNTSSGDGLSNLYLATGNGDGTFNTPVIAATNIGEFLTEGDLNADNKPDIVSCTITRPGGPPVQNIGYSMFVVMGNGDGTFQSPVSLRADYPSDPHLADVNGDGKPDIIAGGSTGALVFQGNGNGTFQDYTEPTIGGFKLTYAVNAGDFNNDGNADLVGTDANNPQAAVSLSQVQQGASAGALADVAVFPLGSGMHNVDASYSGDTIYKANVSSTIELLAAPTPTTLTLAVQPTSATVPGQSVTLTATLSPYTVGPPTTTTDTEPVNFYSGSTLLGSGTLSSGVATLTTTALTAGIDALKAVYPAITSTNTPDTNYLSSTSNTVSATVTGIVVSSSLNPSTYLQNVTFTATVATGDTGSVTFMDGATSLGNTALSGTTAALSLSTLTAGSHNITGVYSGDGTHSTATSPILAQVVNKVTTTVTVATTGSSTYGDSVTITATVTAGATGTVTFTSGGATLGSATANGSGIASITTTALPAGGDTITANYPGDNNYTAGSGSTTQTVAKKAVTSTLTSSANPAVPGSSVTFTDTLPTGVTGSVVFTSGGATIGTATVNNGVAAVSTSTLPLGADSITATYSGDPNYGTSVATMSETIAKLNPTVTVTTSGGSTLYSSVTITASVPAGATGTITFTSGGATLGTGAVSASGTVMVVTTILPLGTDTITANYSGDTTNNPATGTTTQVVSKATTAVIVTTSGPSTYGDPVTITATLPTGATGTVTFTGGGTTFGPVTVGSTNTATVTTTTLPVGNDPIAANYSGDGTNSAATGTTIQVVSKKSTTVGLGSSLNPSTVNQSVTFTATVSNNATGTITFLDGSASLGNVTVASGSATLSTSALTAGPHTITASYGGDTNDGTATSAPLTQTVNKLDPSLPPPTVSSPTITLGGSETITEAVPTGVSGPVTFTEGGTAIGTAPVVSGVATITVTTLPVGTDPITASTPGDTINNPATSPATTVTVNKVTPTIAVSSSLNPSASNQPVTFTATAPTGATGTVTFLDGSTPLGTSTLTNGQASITVPTLTAGSHTITASYLGDTTYSAATSAPLTQTVNKGTPVLPVPVVSSPTIPYGGSETITETVPPGVTGPVTFTDGGTVIGTAPIVGGVATITVTTLPVGSDPITASTPGDANNNPATSPTTTVTVTKLTPVLPPPTVSSTTPAANTPVTISETVPTGVTGTVTFSNGGTVLGTATIVNGVATITVPSLPLGANPITASTPGDATTNPATSPATTVTVAKTTPTVALTSSANPSNINQSVTFTATVPAAVSGTVTFLDGTTVLGTGTVSAAGVATFSTANLTTGTHTITASYGGSDSYGPATSAPLAQVVGKAPTTITLTQSQPTELLGTAVTFTATVAAGVPTPTGTVSFLDGTTVLGSAPLSTNGTVVSFVLSGNAGYATSTLTTGTHTITATYSGDTGFATSTSAPVTNIVQDFTYTVSGAKTQNVFPGDTTSYTFSVAPVGSTTFMSDVTLEIDGLPQGTTYTFSPATIAAGSGATTVTLNVTTSGSLSAGNRIPSGAPMPRRGAPIALGVLGLIGLGAVRKHRRKMPRMLMVLLLFLGTLLPVAALSGCAGGYFTLTPTTYSVTATGTEGTIQHSATATLVVQ